jgi:hypothetical protein
MPAKAGIHLKFRWQAKDDLDSGLRRNDERKIRLLEEFRTPLEPRVVQFLLWRQSLTSPEVTRTLSYLLQSMAF